jgi:hypothetical protein
MYYMRKIARLLFLGLLILLSVAIASPLLLFLVFLLLIRPLKRTEKKEAQPPYVSGSVEVSPNEVVAGGNPVPVKVTYRVGPEGIDKGGAIRLSQGKILRFGPGRWRLSLQWANGWGLLQRRRPGKPDFVEVSMSRSGADLEVSLMERAIPRSQLAWLKRKFLQKAGFRLECFDPKDTFLENQKVMVTVAGGRLEKGDTVEFSLGAGQGLEVPYEYMETDFAIEVDPRGSGEFLLEAAVPTIKAVGGEPFRFEVIAPSTAAPGEKILVLVRCLDSRGVLTPNFSGSILLSSSGEVQVPKRAVFPEGGEGVTWFEAIAVGRGIGRIHARDGAGKIEGESNPVVCAEGQYRLLWGDMHTHSLVSDGTMEPGYFYHRARDLLGWGFTVVADHDIWSLGEEYARSQEELELMFRTAEENYGPGRFVTFPAYEWTEHHHGHRNVVFGPGERPEFFPHTDPECSTPESLMRTLEGRNVILIPHHPAWKTHYGEMRFDWGPAGNPPQRLVEVYSRHGCSEFYGCPRPLTHVALMEGIQGKVVRAFLGDEFAGPDSGSYVRDALAAGHRLGIVAGSDEHLVAADPRKGIGQIYEGGITGVFATAATREAVWEALWNRRVCATTGARILMELRVNGELQGAELKADSPPRITGHVVGTADLELVELVKFDGEKYSTPRKWEGSGPEAVIDFTDKDFRRDSFYYLRALQSDGHIGWAGPTWVDYGVRS